MIRSYFFAGLLHELLHKSPTSKGLGVRRGRSVFTKSASEKFARRESQKYVHRFGPFRLFQLIAISLDKFDQCQPRCALVPIPLVSVLGRVERIAASA